MTDDAHRTTLNDGQRPSAIVHLSDLGDLKNYPRTSDCKLTGIWNLIIYPYLSFVDSLNHIFRISMKTFFDIKFFLNTSLFT